MFVPESERLHLHIKYHAEFVLRIFIVGAVTKYLNLSSFHKKFFLHLCSEVCSCYISIAENSRHVLSCVVLCCAVLCCVVLCCAVLCCVVLYCAVLCWVVLCFVVFCCVVLGCAVLCWVVLCFGVFCWVVLCFAVLC